MANECAQGTFGRVLFKIGTAPYTWSSGAVRLPLFNENLIRHGQIHHPPILTGDRSEHAERTRFGPNKYVGSITMIVSPGDLQTLLPAMLGGTFVGTTIGLGNTLPICGFLIDRVSETFEYQDALIDKWVLYGRQHMDEDGEQREPNWMILKLFIVAKLEATAVAFPAGVNFSTGAEFTEFVFEDLALTLQGATRDVKELYIEMHNNVRSRYVNNLNPTALCPGPRMGRLLTTHPYDLSHKALYDQALAGAAGSAAFTNGTIGTTFNFAKLQVPANAPFLKGHTEIGLTLEHAFRMTGSTDELTVTNDATP